VDPSTFIVLSVCVVALCLLVNQFAREERRQGQQAEGGAARPTPPMKRIAPGILRGFGWLVTLGFLDAILSPYGDREKHWEPLRGWRRAAGLIVLVAFFAGFAFAMATGDYSGIWGGG